MQLLIDHVTRYRYAEPAAGIVQLLKLTPRESDCQQVVNWRVDVEADGRLLAGRDSHGNLVHRFYADRPVSDLVIHVTGHVITTDCAGIVRTPDEPLPPALYTRTTALTSAGAAIEALAAPHAGRDPLDRLHALMLDVRGRMAFEPGTTDVVTDAETAFRLGRGVCQDFAQVFIAAARRLGVPARYVSGHYAAPDHPEQEAAHAWAEAHVPGLGWVSFDPTHGVCGTEGHVRVAVGLDSLDAAPVRGTRRGGGIESLAVGVHGRALQPQRQGQAQGQTQQQAGPAQPSQGGAGR
ncbi:MAG: transglutaminase domain-containing protein [Sphingomonadaceae bacterium]